MQRLTTPEIHAARLDDWTKLAQGLHARFTIGDFPAGAAFVKEVADAAEAAAHHPDLTLRYGAVDVALATHEEGMWVTQKDVDLARTISAIARAHGLEPTPGAGTQVELGLDTAHSDRISPFWSAVLTGSPDNVVEQSILDPTGSAPNAWFQQSDDSDDPDDPDDPDAAPRQRWHLDVWVAPEAAERRIAAALAAGGVVVDDSQAPSFTVLADPDGNKACICTSLERG
jgi:4a-hydroxytetrahydrobiopterin dehydratase